MGGRPVLGIICCNRTVGVETAQAVMNRYVRSAMKYADTAALLAPSLPDLMAASEIVDRLDGVLLTGSPSNIESLRYGEAGGEAPFDPARDTIALDLIHLMIARRRPVFGICRGFQEINVALGGTLRRDANSGSDLIRHHAPNEVDFKGMFDHRHDVALEPDGVLAKALGKTRAQVNSVHFQGVARLAPPLTVEARAPDGLIEAFSGLVDGAPLLAVQWHPEWETELHPDNQVFFHLLGRALRGGPLTPQGPTS